MNPFQYSKTKAKILLLVAIIAIPASVGGILLFSSLSAQQAEEQIRSQPRTERLSLPTQDQTRQRELIRFAKREEDGISEPSIAKAEWLDLAFGCRKEGQVYAPSIVTGPRIGMKNNCARWVG